MLVTVQLTVEDLTQKCSDHRGAAFSCEAEYVQ